MLKVDITGAQINLREPLNCHISEAIKITFWQANKQSWAFFFAIWMANKWDGLGGPNVKLIIRS